VMSMFEGVQISIATLLLSSIRSGSTVNTQSYFLLCCEAVSRSTCIVDTTT
jgi:hypothetical protein